MAIVRAGPLQVAKVTGALALGGASVGGLCAMLASATFTLIDTGWRALGELTLQDGFAIFGIGATLGGIAVPLVSWSLLRRVPLGRLLMWGIPASIVGALVGDLVLPFRLYGGWLQ